MLSTSNASSRLRIAAAIAASTLALAGLPLLPSTASAAEPDVVLTPNPAQAGPAFKGWGTSLVWMANATGQYPEAIRSDLIDKVFGDDGLNLNIARYNIGGGNAGDIPDYLRPGGAVPGWWNPAAGLSDQAGPITANYADRDRFLAAWSGQNASDYNLEADASQRAWIAAIKDKVTTWEAFSNSPPYFMTESGYVSGGLDPNADQIKPEAIGKFVNYLKTAAQHVEQSSGISFDTINPLNEPNTNYWKTTIGGDGLPNGGGQEGAHAGPALQSQVLTAMAAELAEQGTTTEAKVSGPDETSPSRFVEDWNGWTPETKQAVSQLNVHTYSTGDRMRVRDIAKSAGKPLSMSEVEGNWGGDSWNPNSIENGLGMATRITDDLRELDPESWVLWQPVEDLYNMELGEKKNWGSVFIDFDCNAEGDSARRIADGAADPSCRSGVNSKYNTIRNFTHYIEPGDRIIPTSDGKTTSAVKNDGSGAVMVHTNDSDQAKTVKLDLSRFATIGAGATVTPVVTTESPAGSPTANALVSGAAVAIDAGTRSATLTVPAKSVTTFIVNGASGVAADAPAVQDGQSYSFVGVQSGRAVTASSGPATVLGDSVAAPTQVWTATRIADEDGTTRDRFVLRLADGRALAADASGTVLRTLTDQEASADSSAQWLFNTTDGTSFSLLNAAREQVLDVANQATAAGSWIGLWTSNGGANQSFTLRTASEGTGYTSFRPGQEWRDNNGNLIQAHGGQVVTSKDSEGRTIYYLYGEDRTNGYHSSPGVHAYSSYDLYNWKDEGVALKAMSSPDQFSNDPYFQNLYSGYTTEQKNAVYRDLGTVPANGETPPILERPKVIYNAATNKWVMWVHADGPSEWSTAQYAKANAGVAVSDSPFGPFRYIDSYRLHKAAAGDPTNLAPNNPGMARDMNLFVDDDGTGYIIYSSEENKTMFISKLNADYTYLSASPDTAVEGVDFRRAFVNVSRESPAIFKYQGRYFIITSGTTGWSPNPSEYGTSTSILGQWTQMPNPFSSDVAWNSNNSQPSSVIPVDAANGKFIYMGDRWNGGSDQALATAPMVWLPIQMGEGGKTISVQSPSEWRLGDLDGNSAWNVTGVPSSLAVGAAFNVNSVTVTQNGQSSSQPVTWQVTGSTSTVGIITATGTLPGFGNRTFTRTIPVVPEGVRYAVNAGGQQTSDWAALMNAAEQQEGSVLNSAADQPYGADPATGKSWGYESEGSGVTGTADGNIFTTLRYAAGGRDLTYRFGDLAPGTYTVYAGYYDPWAQWDDRGAKVTVNGAVVEADHDYSGEYQSAAYQNVTVGTDGKLAFALSPTRGPDVQLSWLIIANPVPATTPPPTPTLNVTAVASTKCVSGKAVVNVQATNNEASSVQMKFTSAFGTKSFSAVKPGKNAVHAFSTRAVSIQAGVVSVQATGTVNGQPVTVTKDAAYSAATCS